MRTPRLAAIAALLLACACKSDAPKPTPPPATTPPKPAIDRAKLEPLYRAGKAIEGATDVGVSLIKFGELLQAFATELSIARDRASTPQENALLDQYAEALAAYQDCRVLWGKKIKNDDAFWQGSIVYKILQSSTSKPTTDGELTPIVEEYNLPTKTHSDIGVKWLGIPAGSLQVVMAQATAQLTAANKAYYAEGAPAQ